MARWCASPLPNPRNERALILDHYEWSGGREALLRFGPDIGPVVIVALPLFEEANRVRAFAVAICRALALRGVASALPDLPGQGESLVVTERASLSSLRNAFSGAADSFHHQGYRIYSASIRSGATLVGQAHTLGRWYLSPASGSDLLRDQARILQAAGRDVEARLLRNTFQNDEDATPFEIAGNRIALQLLQDLETDHADYFVPLPRGIPTRVVRLDTDRGEAHRHVPGTPLWRRAEPDNDQALAALLADDIADWIATCEG